MAAVLFTTPLLAAEVDGPAKPRRGIPTIFSSNPAVSSQAPAISAESPLLPVLQAGFDDYALQGAEGALKTWAKNGPLEGDPKILESAHIFHEVEKYYGRYTGFHVIQKKELTPVSRLIYTQINYEKGPFFARFLCYFTGTQWVVAGRLVLDTEPDRVL